MGNMPKPEVHGGAVNTESLEHLLEVNISNGGWFWLCKCGESSVDNFYSREYALAAARRHVKAKPLREGA